MGDFNFSVADWVLMIGNGLCVMVNLITFKNVLFLILNSIVFGMFINYFLISNKIQREKVMKK